MINWKKNKESIISGKRIALKLPDGRVCSGNVTDGGGFQLEPVSSLDLMLLDGDNFEWEYL